MHSAFISYLTKRSLRTEGKLKRTKNKLLDAELPADMKVKVKRAWGLQTLKQKESEEKRENSNDTPRHGYTGITGVVTRVKRWENFLTVTSIPVK